VVSIRNSSRPYISTYNSWSHNDNDGRILLINIEIDENIFTLVNLYANNVEKNRNAFFKKVNKENMGFLVFSPLK
jgi:hypothetical protein